MFVNKTLERARRRLCIACGALPPNDPDHIKTVGSGGADEDQNIWTLCRRDHTLRHTKGLAYMADKFPACKKWLTDHGWEYDSVVMKWRRYETREE